MRTPAWLILSTLWSLASSASFAWANDAPCSVTQAKVDPPSVIEPCSQLISDAALPADKKADAFYARSIGYDRTGKRELAAQDLDVALKLAPMRSDIYVTRAQAEYRLGRNTDAWADLTHALSIDPGSARANREVGLLYDNAGDLNEALRLYTRALATDPAEPYTLLYRSRLHAKRHEFQDALADATALVDMKAPNDRPNAMNVDGQPTSIHLLGLNTRADLYEKIGDQAAADKDYDAALAQERSANTLVARAEHLIRQKQDADALPLLDEAVQLDPNYGDAHYDRGLVLLAAKRDTEALAAFDRAADLHGAVPDLRWKQAYDLHLRASTLRSLGRTDEALTAVEQAICMSPDVKASLLGAMSRAGYWTRPTAPAPIDAAFRASLRACMIDKDCN